jgi:DNA-binding transcriptional LysR family regulator
MRPAAAPSPPALEATTAEPPQRPLQRPPEPAPRRDGHSIDLQQLRYFVAIAEEEHFGRAGKRLRVAQPALSRRMQKLEEELRVQLFDRLPRGIRLTDAGRAFLVDVREVLDSVDRAVQRVRKVETGEVGKLRVGYVDTTMWGQVVAPLLRSYQASHPDIDLDLRRQTSLAQWEGLREGRLDIGVAYFRAPEPEVESISVETQRVMLALPDSHRLAAAEVLTLADLTDEWFIGIDRVVSPMFTELLTRECAPGGLTMRVRQEAGDFSEQIGLVAAELGIAWVIASSSPQLPQNVVLRAVEDLAIELDTFVMWRRDRLGAAGRAFIGALRARLERGLPQARAGRVPSAPAPENGNSSQGGVPCSSVTTA